MTDEPKVFMEMVFANESFEVVIDECGEMIGKHAKEMTPLATRSRHFGHVVHFICQRAQQLDPTIRDQCNIIYCFQQSKKDAETLSIGFVDESLKEASNLRRGEFIFKKRFEDSVKTAVF